MVNPAESPTPPTGATPSAEPAPDTWATDAADAIERAVTKVRAQTADRAAGITTGVVYGLLAVCFGIPAVILVVVLLFRALVSIYGGEVWAAWLTLGAIFVITGTICWSRARRIGESA